MGLLDDIGAALDRPWAGSGATPEQINPNPWARRGLVVSALGNSFIPPWEQGHKDFGTTIAAHGELARKRTYEDEKRAFELQKARDEAESNAAIAAYMSQNQAGPAGPQAALGDSGLGAPGPTMQRAAAMQQQQPATPQQKLAERAEMYRGVAHKLLTLKKPNIEKAKEYFELADKLEPQPKYHTVAPGGSLVSDRDPTRPTYVAPDTVKEKDPNKPFMMIDGKIVPNPDYQKYALNLAAAGRGKTDVAVHLGQKGLENTLKVRDSFKAEPIYKAYQGVMAAHGQITTALSQPSPAGDLTAVTKFLKVLDSESVARESEVAAVMAATGLVDRVRNYANMLATGQKLTPDQRKDFKAVSDRIAIETEKLYNAKRVEYEGIANRNQLNVQDVLGPPGAALQTAPGERPALADIFGRK